MSHGDARLTVHGRLLIVRRHQQGWKQAHIAAAGINHMILAITDRALVKALMGRELEGVPDINNQLQLVHDKVMPAFA